MRDTAMDLLLEVGAVVECEHDPGIYVDQRGGSDAARNVGLKLIKLKDRRVSALRSRPELDVALDLALGVVVARCGLCDARAGR